MRMFGVDPGASGCIAVLDATDPRYVSLQKLSESEGDIREFIAAELALVDPGDCRAYIERVHSMPKQGVASSFKFGVSYGFLRGVLLCSRIPFEEVTPQKWQKAMGCMSKGDKNVTKARAQQLFPNVKVTHANADALLIAEYARRVKSGELAGAQR